jgi:hypothetical protein
MMWMISRVMCEWCGCSVMKRMDASSEQRSTVVEIARAPLGACDRRLPSQHLCCWFGSLKGCHSL